MQNINNLSTLSKTLFIPLIVRARETLSNNPLIKDEKAVEIIGKCDAHEILTECGDIATHGILSRTIVIDAEVKAILDKYPDSIVINIGIGLNTRFFRFDNGKAQWYDLDLPEVISLRKQFIIENERLHFLSGSVLDKDWTDEIHRSENDKIIVLAEGLLMYFTKEEVCKILHIIKEAFPNAEMFFDVVHTYFINKKISSTFLWGIDKASDIMKLDPSITLIKSWSIGYLLKKRQPFIFRLLNILPSTRNRSQIIHIKMKG